MSNRQTRQDIAAALSTVPGVNGHAARPTAMNEGDAWPQWRGGVPVAGTLENTWAVLIVMPQADDITADGFADDHLYALLAALRPHLFVDSVAPAEIPTDSGTLYALMITGRSE